MRVVVVGAGVGGLAAAHALASAALPDGSAVAVTLCEAGTRLGGHLHTVRDDGLLLEVGADSLVTRKPAGIELCREIGLGDELVAARATRPAAQVVRAGRLHDLPDGPAMAVPTGVAALLRDRLYSPAGKLRLLAERFVRRRRATGDEPLGELVRRRLGREAFERVVEPVFGGLFTGDAARFGSRWVAPSLVEQEARWGSFAAGAAAGRREARRRTASRGDGEASPAPAQLAPRLGMDEIVRALAARFAAGGRGSGGRPGPLGGGVTVETACDVAAVRRGEHGRGFVVERAGHGELACAGLVLAVPSGALARLLGALEHEASAPLAGDAGALAYAPCATVALAYPRRALVRPLRGLGLFVPRGEGTPVLAVSYASEKFPGRAPPSMVLLRVFLGGALHPEVIEREDRELVDIAHERVAAWLGLPQRPGYTRVDRHAAGIPQLVAGCGDAIGRLRAGVARIRGLAVAGSALGLYGIADCVASGRAAAAGVLAALAAEDAR